MVAEPEILRHPSPDALARTVTTRLLTQLAEIQREQRVPQVVLTGGSIAASIHQNVVSSPLRNGVDWGNVGFWWGDERFVPSGDPERNAGQAEAAMLGALPVDPANVHAMPASDGPYGDDADAAAAAYADELADAFDILMLGVGPDGHCASLFPGRTEQADERAVVAVRDSPKPPPTRISMTMATLNTAREVWFVAAGEGKAGAVAAALSGADPFAVPAAGPHGFERTVWFLDDAAASRSARR